MTQTSTDILRIADFSIYQVDPADVRSFVVWDHENGARLGDRIGVTRFAFEDAVSIAREYADSAPAERPTYLAS